jgi:hypothetical protein
MGYCLHTDESAVVIDPKCGKNECVRLIRTRISIPFLILDFDISLFPVPVSFLKGRIWSSCHILPVRVIH